MATVFQKQALKSLKDQIGDQPLDQVYVIELDGIPFEEITPEMKSQFENFSALQMLTINNCGLTSLKNFPHCPALIRLDLISNKLKGSDLYYLKNIRHQNQFTAISDFNQITHMHKLLQLNLIGNDVCDVQDYEKQIFALFPSLKILDGYDRNQKQPSEQNLLKESVNRINKNLFEQKPVQSIFSQPSIFMPIPVGGNAVTGFNPVSKNTLPIQEPKKSQKKDSKKQIKKKEDKMQIEEPKKKNLKRSITKLNSKTNLIFPKGRLTRYLRQRLPGYRISPKAGVFLTGCIEYLCFEMLEIAAGEVKNAKKKRIQPEHIIKGVNLREQLFAEVFRNVTVAGKSLI